MTDRPSEEEILALVRQFAADRDIDPNRIVPDAQLSALGIDSLQAINLIFMFEDKYGVRLPVEDFKADTVAEAVAFVGDTIRARPDGG
jgi:acyl carrier protein